MSLAGKVINIGLPNSALKFECARLRAKLQYRGAIVSG